VLAALIPKLCQLRGASRIRSSKAPDALRECDRAMVSSGR
jgi:hypothetical protein